MRLGSKVFPLPLVLAVVGVGSCAESFGTSGIVSKGGGLKGVILSPGGRPRSFRSATVKLGVGLLGLGGATVYLCSSALSPGPPRPTNPATILRGGPTHLESSSASNETPPLHQDHEVDEEKQERNPRTMLEHTTDIYNGVTVDDAGLPGSTAAFKEMLETSLEAWKSTGKKGVWLKVPADRTELVPVSLEMGFELHHAEKAYVMLNMWLPATANQLPQNASHQVGVGAVVLNDKGEVLVVREKNGPLSGTGVWKFPTGLIDAGENLSDAATREVLEETGLQTEFDSVLAFRHGHRGLFGKSDLFFVVRMRLKPGEDASALQPQESEIEECQWMHRQLFAKQSAESGTVLLKELSTIMEAHIAAEVGNDQTRVEGGEAKKGQQEIGEEEDESRSGGTQRHAAAFTAKMLKSSRKYGGTSMLYHGKL